jgi:predicted nucleotide-binding protein (sugar kinase/HSP70/actin superfamily)
MAALKSGRYDLSKTAVIMSQTGGGCRASNYIGFIRKALKDAGMGHIPDVSLNAVGLEDNPGFKLSMRMIKRCVMAMVYGDLLMRLTNATRPYEKNKGETNLLLEKWLKQLKPTLAKMSIREYHQNIRSIVREFDNMELLDIKKPKVGVVGEILVKFHPFANNFIVDILEKEGAEAVLPDLIDFFLYCAHNGIYSREKLAGTLKAEWLSRYLIWRIENYRRVMKKELKKSKRFQPPKSIFQLADLAGEIMHLGHQTGEGWFLTAEMLELMRVAPAILPVSSLLPVCPIISQAKDGTGTQKALSASQYCSDDYDPGESQVNQVNRYKLMLSCRL